MRDDMETKKKMKPKILNDYYFHLRSMSTGSVGRFLAAAQNKVFDRLQAQIVSFYRSNIMEWVCSFETSLRSYRWEKRKALQNLMPEHCYRRNWKSQHQLSDDGRARSVFKSVVPVLRQTLRPYQRSVVGGRRFSAAVQPPWQRKISVVAKRDQSRNADTSADTLAFRGLEDQATQGYPWGKTQRFVLDQCPKTIQNNCLKSPSFRGVINVSSRTEGRFMSEQNITSEITSP